MSEKILIVEDQEFFRKILVQLLGVINPQFEVIVAEDGLQACKLAETENPDIIIMDWEMPVMKGIEAVRIIKQKEATKNIPIIMATRHMESEKLEEAFEAGVNDYLRKPFDKTEFKARVKSALVLAENLKKTLEQNKCLVSLSDNLEKSNVKMRDSLTSARRIQEAGLAPKETIKKHLPESFIIYNPKDIVSGDFYWFGEIDKKIIIAVVDCTGHGVPGSFIAMIGNTLLNLIVNTHRISLPSKILKNLNKAISNDLNYELGSENTIYEGMDISVVCIDMENRVVTMAGAGQKIYMHCNNELKSISGDIISLGDILGKLDMDFTDHVKPIVGETKLYLNTDGLFDQFGGKDNKKLMSHRFEEWILANHHLPMVEQEIRLEKYIADWKGNLPQTDDILVVGVKI